MSSLLPISASVNPKILGSQSVLINLSNVNSNADFNLLYSSSLDIPGLVGSEFISIPYWNSILATNQKRIKLDYSMLNATLVGASGITGNNDLIIAFSATGYRQTGRGDIFAGSYFGLSPPQPGGAAILGEYQASQSIILTNNQALELEDDAGDARLRVKFYVPSGSGKSFTSISGTLSVTITPLNEDL
jgi:hypothetical protein